MSDLNPKGTPIMLDGVERRLLFTLNVIDEVQAHCGCAFDDVIDRLRDREEAPKTLRYLVMVLLNDEKERTGNESYKTYTEKEAGWLITQENLLETTVAVLEAYGLSLPEPDEFDSPNGESGQSE